jgi:transposase-like protein
MMQSGLSEVRRVRRWRSISEKRQIVQLTMEAGASVAEVAREHGLNANQVFKWRRAFERGELTDDHAALLPVKRDTTYAYPASVVTRKSRIAIRVAVASEAGTTDSRLSIGS